MKKIRKITRQYLWLCFLLAWACSPQQNGNGSEKSTQNQSEEFQKQNHPDRSRNSTTPLLKNDKDAPSPYLEREGIIQSSGLTEKEKAENNLEDYSNFQLLTDSTAYYLKSGKDLVTFWGKCVKISGRLDTVWAKNYTSHTYGRQGFIIKSIERVSFRRCFPQDSLKKKTPHLTDSENLTGVIQRTFRPAPDIAYDYVLILEEPFIFEESQMVPNERITKIRLTIPDKKLYPTLEKYVQSGKRVTLSGYKERGYAESLTFSVIKIRDQIF